MSPRAISAVCSAMDGCVIVAPLNINMKFVAMPCESTYTCLTRHCALLYEFVVFASPGGLDPTSLSMMMMSPPLVPTLPNTPLQFASLPVS